MSILIDEQQVTKNVDVSFGSCQNRRLFPEHSAFNRLGGGIPRDSKIGPDRYNIDDVTSIKHNIDTRPTNKLGYTLGARTGPRIPKLKCHKGNFAHDLTMGLELDFPGPQAYQKLDPRPVKENAVAFNQSSSRSDDRFAHNSLPAPGTYEHDIPRNRQIQYAGSFGGKQVLVPTISIKCGQVNDDICDSCKRPPIGDYWNRGKKSLCRNCHSFHLTYGEKYPLTYLQGFRKVRFCSDIHHHEGTTANIKMRDPKLEYKQRVREAKFALHF